MGGHGRKPPNPQRVPKSHGKKPPPPPHTSRPNKDCCALLAAARSARRGRWRLAYRYTVRSARLIAARLA
jgi:hypothetical protein